MEPYSSRALDGPITPVEGFQNIDSIKSYELLSALDVENGTFIVRPRDDNKKKYIMDVKKVDTVENYKFHKNKNVYSFKKRGQDTVSANSITNLIEEILKQNKWQPYKNGSSSSNFC